MARKKLVGFVIVDMIGEHHFYKESDYFTRAEFLKERRYFKQIGVLVEDVLEGHFQERKIYGPQ